MFPIYVNNENFKEPKDDIYYLIGKNGIFLKRKLPLIESLVEVNGPSFLENVISYSKLLTTKIPDEIFRKVLKFFREVYSLYHSESVVLLFYNEKKKSFRVGVPFQKVSSASCHAVKMGSPRKYVTVGSIHSHPSFGAFHSGVDDSDELYAFDGIHITIGNVNDEEFSISCSVTSNKKRFKTDPLEYIEGIKEVKEEDIIDETNLLYPFIYYYGRNDKKYKKDRYITVNKDPVEIDKNWLTYVESIYPNTSEVMRSSPSNELNKSIARGMNRYGGISLPDAEPKSRNDPCEVCPFSKGKRETPIEQLMFEGF